MLLWRLLLFVAVQSASDATRVSAFSVDLWRLLLFVAVQSASNATRVSAFSVLGLTCVSVEAASIIILRAI